MRLPNWKMRRIERMVFSLTEISCGVGELSGFYLLCGNELEEDPNSWNYRDLSLWPKSDEAAVFQGIHRMSRNLARHSRKGCIVFSDSVRNKDRTCSGYRFAMWLRKNKKGKVISSGKFNNPNTDNDIVVWTWVLN